MKREISAGAVIFKKGRDGKIFYLLLRHGALGDRRGFWAFPKGHIEKGESEPLAAKREIFEETGLKELKFISGFRALEKYVFRGRRVSGLVFKIVVFYLAQATVGVKVRKSWEHEAIGWFTAQEVLKKLRYPKDREIFKVAERFLKIVGLNYSAQEIFELVKKIPPGRVTTYQAVAGVLKIPNKTRFVGYVLNKNTDPAIPCHRVVKSFPIKI